MGKWLKRIVLTALAAVFLFAGGSLMYKRYEDSRGEKNYEDAADRFVDSRPRSTVRPSAEADEPPAEAEDPPIVVDFASLRAVNEDVIGWLYCEGTVINYPVLHGSDNDQYLRHLYDRSYSNAGSIFIEAENRTDFSDTNTIIYGHNMRDGTMFACLDEWKDQSFYEEHPSMWLLTPGQDYRLDILGGYYTSAYSDVYTVFRGHSKVFDDFLAEQLSQSVIDTHAEIEPNACYVLLSTCVDRGVMSREMRFVIHGKLVPVDSVDGVKIIY